MITLGQEILNGLREALAHAEGKSVPDTIVHRVDVDSVDARIVRKKLRLTQEQMALALGTSPSGYRKWEQGQRQPSGAARTLLKVMDKEPEAVLRVLSER